MRYQSHVAVVIVAAAVAALTGFLATGNQADASMRLASDQNIATCALPEIVNDLMQSDRFKPARQEYTEQLQEELRPLAERLQSMLSELQGMTPEDEGAREKAQRFQQLQQEFQKKQNEMAQKVEKFTAEQIVDCYKLVRSSAAAVAEDLGFDYVISTVGQEEELTTESVDTVLRQMMARPVIKAPEDADITPDVKEDLNLE